MKKLMLFVLVALLSITVCCAGCGGGGGGSVAPAKVSAPERNNDSPGSFFPDSAYVEKIPVAKLATQTIDVASLRATNCTWHAQMTIPQDSATSLIQAMQTVMPYAQDGGNIEKNLNAKGEIVMILPDYRGAGIGAEYNHHEIVLYQEPNFMLGDQAVLQMAHEFGHMQDQGYEPNEFMSYLFESVITIVAYNSHPAEYCEDNSQKNPLQEMIADFANYNSVDYIHERGYIATMLLTRNDSGDIQKMIHDASDPTTFKQYLDNADSFISVSDKSDFSKLYCSSVTSLLEKNVTDTAFTDSMLSWVKCK